MNKRNVINNNWGIPMKIFIIFLFLIVVLYIQLFRLSFFAEVDNINMDEFAKMRNTENRKLSATRGSIYDREGNVLALNVSSYTVIAYLDESRTTDMNNPYHVVDKEKTASALAPILDMEVSYILELLNQDLYQVELGPGGRDIGELKKDEIVDLNLPGISFISKSKRFYPNGNFASYILGYAKTYEEIIETENGTKINYDIVGELGIEDEYDEILKGIDGSLIFQKDQHGYKIPDTKEERIDAINGKNIYLTIDAAIQRFIEAEVKEVYENYKPEWIQMSVMDAKTGQILGSVSSPSFDPNLRDMVNYENPLTSYVFEPGSTMKTYTYMCAMEKGNYKGDELYQSGKITIGTNVVADWNNVGWGKITYDKGYEYSSNVAIANLLEKVITKDDLLDCLQKYGFGKKTNIELPRELEGSLNFNYAIEVAAAGYGQGITTTAIQHLQALSIIANNGTMLKPHVVDKIIDPNTNEIVYSSKIDKIENVVSKPTIEKIKDLMYKVIHETDFGTTGTAYRIDGFDVLGKTGTAEIYENGRYLTGYNDYIYSFTGMYPNNDPEIIIYAAIKQPSQGRGSSLSAATKSLMKNIAKYRNMFSEQKEESTITTYELPSFINKNISEVKKDLLDKKITPIILGNGDRIIDQYPAKNTVVLTHDKVFLQTNDSNLLMPNTLGWSRNEIISFCNMANIKYKFNGYGYVDAQSILVNSLLKKNDILELNLKQKFNINQDDKEEQTDL
ncbi:MAG: penicillin-binding protein [Bacilli bacterium]|nr:penicillin-binding protein [Bacilli bacterium]